MKEFVSDERETAAKYVSGGQGGASGCPFLSEERWEEILQHLQLSPRESEIVSLFFRDVSEAKIAEQLAISKHTVHSHIERLYRKLGVASRCGVAIRVFESYVRLLD